MKFHSTKNPINLTDYLTNYSSKENQPVKNSSATENKKALTTNIYMKRNHCYLNKCIINEKFAYFENLAIDVTIDKNSIYAKFSKEMSNLVFEYDKRAVTKIFYLFYKAFDGVVKVIDALRDEETLLKESNHKGRSDFIDSGTFLKHKLNPITLLVNNMRYIKLVQWYFDEEGRYSRVQYFYSEYSKIVKSLTRLFYNEKYDYKSRDRLFNDEYCSYQKNIDHLDFKCAFRVIVKEYPFYIDKNDKEITDIDKILKQMARKNHSIRYKVIMSLPNFNEKDPVAHIYTDSLDAFILNTNKLYSDVMELRNKIKRFIDKKPEMIDTSNFLHKVIDCLTRYRIEDSPIMDGILSSAFYYIPIRIINVFLVHITFLNHDLGDIFIPEPMMNAAYRTKYLKIVNTVNRYKIDIPDLPGITDKINILRAVLIKDRENLLNDCCEDILDEIDGEAVQIKFEGLRREDQIRYVRSVVLEGQEDEKLWEIINEINFLYPVVNFHNNIQKILDVHVTKRMETYYENEESGYNIL